MEYMEQAFSNTFYPFQKKQHIQRNIQIVKMLCPLRNPNVAEIIKWASSHIDF